MTDHHHESLVETQILNEMYYKTMMTKVDPNWLPHKDYSHLIPYVKYQGTNGNTQRYFVPNHYNGWMTYIRFEEWYDQVQDMSLNAVEAARLLFWGANIKVHCGCPAFLFWGHEYVATMNDAAIVPETRFPHVRNPYLKGICCKHLIRTLKVLPFHLGDIASEIKKQRQELGLLPAPKGK